MLVTRTAISSMENHYKTLGLNSSATPEEIRRAYRVLARRYHPDVNPGKTSEERFKVISEAYSILSDPDKRRAYDVEREHLERAHLNRQHQAYRRNQGEQFNARKKFYESKVDQFGKISPEQPGTARAKGGDKPSAQPNLWQDIQNTWSRFKKRAQPTQTQKPPLNPGRRVTPGQPPETERAVNKISVIEVSVTMRDVIMGVKKTVEISEPEGIRKVSVRLPPGVRSGSVVHMRSRNNSAEDMVIIVRVASHPLLSNHTRGLVFEIPITIGEAIAGANVTLPTLDEPAVVKIPPGAQSGTEIRLKGRGIQQKDGSRGDLIYRLMIRLPDALNAIGLQEKASALAEYYGSPPRTDLPRTILEGC